MSPLIGPLHTGQSYKSTMRLSRLPHARPNVSSGTDPPTGTLTLIRRYGETDQRETDI